MHFSVSLESQIFESDSRFYLDCKPNGELFEINEIGEMEVIRWIFDQDSFSECEIEIRFGPSGLLTLAELIKVEVVKNQNYPSIESVAKEVMGLDAIPPQWIPFVKYHISVNNFPFFNMGSKEAKFVDNELMQQYRESASPPGLISEVKSDIGMQCRFFEEILNERQVEDGVLCKNSLNCVLDFAMGVRSQSGGRDIVTDDRNYWELPKLHKVVPSGGGRHPTEAFVVIKDLANFGSGLFFFDPISLQLKNIGDGLKLCNELSVNTNEAAIVLSPEYIRAMWRYRDPRSFRAIPIDVGHVVGAIESMCSYLNLTFNLIPDFDADEIRNLIGIGSPTHIPMAIVKMRGKK